MNHTNIINAARQILTKQNQPRNTWPTPGHLAQHLDPRTRNTPALKLIDAHLTQLLDTPDGRLIISMPPQEGKSVRCSRDFPIWALLQNPELRIVTASYGQSLANRNGRTVRNTITAHPELGLTIAHDNGAAAEWTLAGHNGGVLAVGRGAGVTGRAAECLIIDDPLKDRAEADSATIRDTCWDWWTDALAARLAPGAPALLIMTRWHEDDLAGRLIAYDTRPGWRVLNIPAQCDNPATDPLGRNLGEFMESARGRTLEQWEQRKHTAGPTTWASLYQGHPSPPEGGIFNRRAWQYYRTPPAQFDTVIQSWDLAFKGGPSSDYVVGQVWGRIGANLYLLDQARGRWGFNDTVTQIRNTTARWPDAHTKLVEDKANGSAVIDYLRNEIPGLKPVNPEGGKEARAAIVEPFLAAGNIHLPDPTLFEWVAELVEEAAGFPNATHDDQVDALTQAVTHLMVTRHTHTQFYGF